MSKTYNLTTPLTEEQTRGLKSGDIVYLNGTIFTARDAAHKRLVDLIEAGEELPFDLEGSIIYFVGPTPPKPGDPIGSAGPTTSYRMDSYSPTMLKNGSRGMIGKGKRNQEVKDAFLFSCFTGLRYSDVVNLTWDNISNDKIEFKQRKTGGVEYLPISQTAKDILVNSQNSKNKSKFIFDVPTKVGIFKHIKKWVKDAGIKKRVSFHTARHTFATMALTQGVDLYTVSKLLGHKDISTTQVYAKIIDSKKDEAVNKLPILSI